jgi:hypothetical protein
MQKKFLAICFLVGALGVVSLQAANDFFSSSRGGAGGKEHTSWIQWANKVVICAATVNVPLQVTGYAITYAQTVAPLFGWTGSIGGTIASRATSVITKWS